MVQGIALYPTQYCKRGHNCELLLSLHLDGISIYIIDIWLDVLIFYIVITWHVWCILSIFSNISNSLLLLLMILKLILIPFVNLNNNLTNAAIFYI